jgi:hypothetical protein
MSVILRKFAKIVAILFTFALEIFPKPELTFLGAGHETWLKCTSGTVRISYHRQRYL